MQAKNQWGQSRGPPPSLRPALPSFLNTAPMPNTPESGAEQDVKVSPPPPYTPTVYDPNAADALEDWDDTKQ